MAGEEGALKTPLMSAATHDPFYVVKDEVTLKLSEIEKKKSRFVTLLWESNTSSSVEFKESRKTLKTEIRACDAQLKDLELTVSYVEKDRSAFSHIDDRELEERKKFVATAREAVSSAKEALASARSKIEEDDAKALSAERYGAKTDIEMANTDFIHRQHAATRTIMAEQDENLEQLDGAVDRVHRMAEEIHGELKSQSRLIGDLEQEMDETTDKMNFVMGKLAKLLKTKDTCQLWTIVILTVVLIIMILMLVFGN